MQVLCKASDNSPDVSCPVCNKGFLLYWERSSKIQQLATLPEIRKALLEHHEAPEFTSHPDVDFNIPSWSGLPQFSAAALLGGAML
jgi:hypothetical protein